MKRSLHLIALLIMISAVFAFTSCKRDSHEDKPYYHQNITKGILKGTIYAQNGLTTIAGAKVFVDDEGEIYLTLTDPNGEFTLEAPSGTQLINIQTGHGKIFRSQTSIDITPNGITLLPKNQSLLTQAADLAYIKGKYDDIETIIIDSLGYTATEITVSDLDNLAYLQTFQGLFLNCGKTEKLDSLKYANLLKFTIDGGSIYASDWAVEYLTGDGNFKKSGSTSDHHHGHIANHSEQTKFCNPDVGGFIPDSTLCTKKTGPSQIIQGASIIAGDLQAFIGHNNIDIQYNLGSWEVVNIHSLPWEVIVYDSIKGYGPLALRMNMGQLFSSKNNKDNQGWVTICHIPPGNPNNPITITVSVNALPAHLAHGDYLGACVGSAGNIYYTTFHNHPQGSISPDMKKLLEYFILNL